MVFKNCETFFLYFFTARKVSLKYYLDWLGNVKFLICVAPKIFLGTEDKYTEGGRCLRNSGPIRVSLYLQPHPVKVPT